MSTLSVMFFPDYDQNPPGRHRVQPSHSFTTSIMRPNAGEDSARTTQKFDNLWRQKHAANFGRLNGVGVPARVDYQDIPDRAASRLWPEASRPGNSRPASSAGSASPLQGSWSEAARAQGSSGDGGISSFYETSGSIRGACPSQQTMPMRTNTTCLADDKNSSCPATMNRTYGLGLSVSEGSLQQKPIKAKKLVKYGKPFMPPTSNSQYGHFTQMKAHKNAMRPKGTCAETKFVGDFYKVTGELYQAGVRRCGVEFKG